MEKMKMGRPRLNATARDKTLSIRVTPEELEEIQAVCIKHNIRYIDVVKKGVEYWSRKK